jgi:hypothetical protein
MVYTDHMWRNLKYYATYSVFLEPSTENDFVTFTSVALPVHASIIPAMKLVSYVAFLICLSVLGERFAQQRGVTEVSSNGNSCSI